MSCSGLLQLLSLDIVLMVLLFGFLGWISTLFVWAKWSHVAAFRVHMELVLLLQRLLAALLMIASSLTAQRKLKAVVIWLTARVELKPGRKPTKNLHTFESLRTLLTKNGSRHANALCSRSCSCSCASCFSCPEAPALATASRAHNKVICVHWNNGNIKLA